MVAKEGTNVKALGFHPLLCSQTFNPTAGQHSLLLRRPLLVELCTLLPNKKVRCKP